MAALYLILGIFAGVMQAHLLRGAPTNPSPLGFFLRLGVVTATLLAAAFGGHLLVAVAGWAGGFTFAVFLFVRRWT